MTDKKTDKKKFWCSSPVNDHVECEKASAFLADLSDLCQRHGIYISHEDSQGAFILSPDPDATWIDAASIEPSMLTTSEQVEALKAQLASYKDRLERAADENTNSYYKGCIQRVQDRIDLLEGSFGTRGACE